MIKEIIVVEGKDDIARVKAALDCQVIATGGYMFGKSFLDNLKKLEKRRGIIVLTDPDYQGERIRNRIRRAIPSAKQAYIDRDRAKDSSTGDIGVENASPEIIRDAIKNAKAEIVSPGLEFSMEDLLEYGLTGYPYSKSRRVKLGKELFIGYGNSKQLLNRLNNYGIGRGEFERAMEKILREEESER